MHSVLVKFPVVLLASSKPECAKRSRFEKKNRNEKSQGRGEGQRARKARGTERGEGRQLGGREGGRSAWVWLWRDKRAKEQRSVNGQHSHSYVEETASTNVVSVSSPSLKYLCAIINWPWTKTLLLHCTPIRNFLKKSINLLFLFFAPLFTTQTPTRTS